MWWSGTLSGCAAPQLCSVSSAGLVRSVWLPRHLCPLSRPKRLVFCATCCGQRCMGSVHEAWHQRLWPCVGTLSLYTMWIALVPPPVFAGMVCALVHLMHLRPHHYCPGPSCRCCPCLSVLFGCFVPCSCCVRLVLFPLFAFSIVSHHACATQD